MYNNNRNPDRKAMLQVFETVYVPIWKRGRIWGRDFQHDSKYILDTYYRNPYGYIQRYMWSDSMYYNYWYPIWEAIFQISETIDNAFWSKDY